MKRVNTISTFAPVLLAGVLCTVSCSGPRNQQAAKSEQPSQQTATGPNAAGPLGFQPFHEHDTPIVIENPNIKVDMGKHKPDKLQGGKRGWRRKEFTAMHLLHVRVGSKGNYKYAVLPVAPARKFSMLVEESPTGPTHTVDFEHTKDGVDMSSPNLEFDCPSESCTVQNANLRVRSITVGSNTVCMHNLDDCSASGGSNPGAAQPVRITVLPIGEL